MNRVPRWLFFAVLVLIALSWIPMSLIVRARNVKSAKPPIHVVPDMDNQARFKGQVRNRMFADRRAMRPPVTGAVARGELREDDGFERGRVGEQWVTTIPITVNRPLLERGRERFEIYCSPCHGLVGNGDGAVAKRADALQEGTWTPPSSFHTELVRSRPVGQLFNSITNGIRNMPAYGPQLEVEDRWAVVAYLKALQRSQNAAVEDVPADLRAALR